MEKKEKKERSKTHKILFGTVLTNGIATAAAGIVFMIVAFFFSANDYQAYLLFGDAFGIIPTYVLLYGALASIVGVCCVCAHIVLLTPNKNSQKKKNADTKRKKPKEKKVEE